MAVRDYNQPKRDGALYRRVEYDPAKTNVAVQYCDDCGCHLHKGERERNRILRPSSPTDFAGRGRAHRERLLVERPKTLAARCNRCWDTEGERRQKARLNRALKQRMTEHVSTGKGFTLEEFMAGQRHDVASEGRTYRIRLG